MCTCKKKSIISQVTKTFLFPNTPSGPAFSEDVLTFTEDTSSAEKVSKVVYTMGALTFNSNESYSINEASHYQVSRGLQTERYVYSVNDTIDNTFVDNSKLAVTYTHLLFSLTLKVAGVDVTADVSSAIVVKNSADSVSLGAGSLGIDEGESQGVAVYDDALRYKAPLSSVGITIDEQTVTLTGAHAGTYTLAAQSYTTANQIFNNTKSVTLVAV